MQFNIEVIKVSAPIEAVGKSGGKYTKIEIIYKRLDRDGKVEAKPIFDFANKDVFKLVSELKEGDVRQITSEKDDNGYWQWKAVDGPADRQKQTGGEASTDASPAQTGKTHSDVTRASYTKQAGVGKVTGSNYETKEERAARQVLIVRQSSLSSAVAYFAAKSPKGTSATVGDVINVAAQFENAVFNQAVPLKPAQDQFADMEDDIPQ